MVCIYYQWYSSLSMFVCTKHWGLQVVVVDSVQTWLQTKELYLRSWKRWRRLGEKLRMDLFTAWILGKGCRPSIGKLQALWFFEVGRFAGKVFAKFDFSSYQLLDFALLSISEYYNNCSIKNKWLSMQKVRIFLLLALFTMRRYSRVAACV